MNSLERRSSSLSTTTPDDLVSAVRDVSINTFGDPSHDWQVQGVIALLNGKDVIVSAGTGCGKSRVFQLAGLIVSLAVVLVVTPVKSLLADQVCISHQAADTDHVQVAQLADHGVSAISLTKDTDRKTYHNVAEGHFRLVYITPEIMNERTSKFRQIVMQDQTAFMTNLSAMALDEAHLAIDWKSFRPAYEQLPVLRQLYFHDVPVVALSATFSRQMKRKIIESMNLKEPFQISRTIRRRNVFKMVCPIEKPGFEELDILIPQDLSHIDEIPTTLIFLDNIDRGIDLAHYLRDRLPAHLQKDNKAMEVIRVYNSSISDKAREQYQREMKQGIVRIMICTDALGMGVDIRIVNRVIQWDVTALLQIGPLDQRFGRAGRDPDSQAIGVIFVRKSLALRPPLIGEAEDPLRAAIMSRISTPISAETEAEIRSLLADIDAVMTRDEVDRNKSNEPSNILELGVLMFVYNIGCRHRVMMAIFEDPDTFEEVEAELNTWLCCDNCLYADIESEKYTEPPTILGIPLSLGLAFRRVAEVVPEPNEAECNNVDDVPSEIDEDDMRSQVPIHKRRIELLKEDLGIWRKSISTPIIPAHVLLTDKAIAKLAAALRKKPPTDRIIKDALVATGYRIERSGILKYLPSLQEAVSSSLARSEPLQPPRPITPIFTPVGDAPLVVPVLPWFKTSTQVEKQMILNGKLEKKEALKKKRKPQQERKQKERGNRQKLAEKRKETVKKRKASIDGNKKEPKRALRDITNSSKR